ncbi:hypothetical protein [Photobacterium kishitanii]|uniref:Uncharacterized protein n=1 Tax=Photobacterium kishitanii TaxID=318456 RepID=A0A2T3KMW9_9GAMM|nr:hypothetical protein [Photobacterium kishitanii]PSV01095.1 hypothetical protein C9J27_03490 [Photobacterium kishitanii]
MKLATQDTKTPISVIEKKTETRRLSIFDQKKSQSTDADFKKILSKKEQPSSRGDGFATIASHGFENDANKVILSREKHNAKNLLQNTYKSEGKDHRNEKMKFEDEKKTESLESILINSGGFLNLQDKYNLDNSDKLKNTRLPSPSKPLLKKVLNHFDLEEQKKNKPVSSNIERDDINKKTEKKRKDNFKESHYEHISNVENKNHKDISNKYSYGLKNNEYYPAERKSTLSIGKKNGSSENIVKAEDSKHGEDKTITINDVLTPRTFVSSFDTTTVQQENTIIKSVSYSDIVSFLSMEADKMKPLILSETEMTVRVLPAIMGEMIVSIKKTKDVGKNLEINLSMSSQIGINYLTLLKRELGGIPNANISIGTQTYKSGSKPSVSEHLFSRLERKKVEFFEEDEI